MAVVLTCHHCGSEYACSENIPDPCQKCGLWHPRFKTAEYLDKIVMGREGRRRQIIRTGWSADSSTPLHKDGMKVLGSGNMGELVQKP